jgi:regulator of sigma E protease
MTLALLVIAIFMAVVLVHEFGHFILARRNGVEVEEFGFGFPPRLFGRRFGKTLYSVNLLPLGGFVRLKGESAADETPGTLGAASFWAKVKILLAGVGMNLVLAYVLLLGLCLTGLPSGITENQSSFANGQLVGAKRLMILNVADGSPAQEAGIKTGDVVVSANGKALTEEDELLSFTREQAGKTVNLVIRERGGAERTVSLRLNDGDDAKKEGQLGVTPFQTFKVRYGLSSPLVAANILWQMVWGTLSGLASLVVGLIVSQKVADNVTGPVGIVSILANLRQLGGAYLAAFVVSISVSLAVLNALPIPALDGGRLALIVGQRVTGTPLSAKREAQIHAMGFAFLIGLMLIITYFDLRRLNP